MLVNKIIIVVLTIMITGCTLTDTPYNKLTATPYKPLAEIYTKNNILFYTGAITPNLVLKALRDARNNKEKITTLVINSPGGDMESGMEFGYFVHENQLEVIIEQQCLSACANYILTAASKVDVRLGAIIGWHGGSYQALELWEGLGSNSHIKDFKGWLEFVRPREDEFFKVIGVDRNITTYGQTEVDSCQKKEKTIAWLYTISDLNHMGVNNIQAADSQLTQVNENGFKVSCEMTKIFK